MKSVRLLSVSIFLTIACFGQPKEDTVALYFAFDSATLSPDAIAAVDSFIAHYVNNAPHSPITLKGYCDVKGSLEYNDALSERRVTTVYTYLVNKGVATSTVSFRKGYGKRLPINSNLTPEERRLNRRVEIIWTPVMPAVPTLVIAPPAVRENEPPEVNTNLSKELLDTIRAGATIRLRNINFYGGRHTFLPQARPALEELLEVMKSNPNLVIEIQGHICCVFSGYDAADFDSGDEHLSRNRARAVYDYLREAGIAKSRMTYKGFAGSRPLIFPERTSEDRTLNRRVEIMIVRK